MGHNAVVKWLLTALTLLTAAFPAWAWNAAGHRLIAVVAWQQLSPPARQAITAILTNHPDSHRWIATAREADLGFAYFAEASIWPDTIRNDPRFFDERREAATPLLAGFAEMGQHRHWHYIDLPLDGSPAEGDGELDRRLSRLIQDLRTSAIQPGQQSQTLAWIIHLVGDIHQPLHVGSNHDEGGNLYRLEDPDSARLPVTNLHRWWDDRPGPNWLRGKQLHRAAERLLASYRDPLPPQGTVARWREESWQLASKYGYPSDGIVKPGFALQAQRVTEHQIVTAGFRLGRLLEAIYGEVSRETQQE